ncbi:mevalonate kinase [Candidatus Gottesmanbacteria bacterium RBG_16_38_7b]|uniref:Mevalonate kinase n=1 Tax=Candidatus Gottesmanbacteria bacterium RBG_16_38_7b TaxID=1798372 RepID=A0A1F5YF03_9BACT|nr:MAG: mevalonate kinase [Candidatus Gottesmanbacteria bacterium RBG_16_38_7b]
MINQVKTSAAGKLMLLGEHAVVYGYPCLVTAINKKITVSIKKIPSQDIQLNSPIAPKSVYVAASVSKFFQKYKFKSGLSITTTSEFLPTLGLGSSSAVTVATLKALAQLFEIQLNKSQLFDLAVSVVRSIHSQASGFDVASAVYGGTIYYQIGKPVIQLPHRHLPLLVIYSGTKADTSSIVARVAALKVKNPAKVNNIFKSIASLVDKAKNAYLKSDWPTLGKLFNQNHQLLIKLGVSTDKLDSLVNTALNNGAYGAKLSGAGQGDCVIVLYQPKYRHRLSNALIKIGGKTLSVV